MRIGTLFSGIGSPEQAAKRVWDNSELVFACEWDKFARQSFKANYEIADEHFHKDINDMDGTQYAGKVDIIVGGSPCQDFSIAGLRAGVDGHRGQLIWQYFRIINEVRPPVFIYENVKGMISDKGGKTIQDFLEVFRSIGYFCHWEVLNSKDYGVPQNRERVFIVGFLDHEAYYRFQFAPSIQLDKRLKDVLEENVDEKYYLSAKMTDYLQKAPRAVKPYDGTQNEVPCLQAVYYKTPTDGFYINEGVVGMLDIYGNEQIRRVYGTDGVAPCLQTMQGGNREPKIVAMRGRNPDNPTSRQSGLETVQMIEPNENGTSNCLTSVQKDNLVLEPQIKVIGSTGGGNEMNSRIYSIDGLAPTLNAGNNGGGQSPVKHLTNDYRIRKLTPLECWRLQDFPDEAHEKAKAAGVSDSQRYKQAGNSITVAVMEMIFRQIDTVLKGEHCLGQTTLF